MSKAAQLGAGASFGNARSVSARRAAIGAATAVPTAGVPEPTELPVGLISHNPDNPRDHLRDLDGMTESVQELGVINAITVASVDAYLSERPDRAADLDSDTKYIVVDGHRRLEAARRAGLAAVKVHVDDARVATDEALLETAFVANFHRDNMTDLEQAHALESLVAFYGSQTKAAKRLGISQATISSKLSLLKLSPELQAEVASGTRQVEHVRNLGKLSAEEQRAAADARVAEAKQRSGRNRTATVASAPSTPPPADYHAVISQDSTEERQDAAVSGSSTLQPEPDLTSAVPPQSSTRKTSKSHSSAASVASRGKSAAADVVPWHDVDKVAELIRSHMTEDDRALLAELLRKAPQDT
ncbi:ParB/RepB/Spo0J family partition protein [Streptomyces sp. NPDC026673]|uniref:ParB/RepB/Spo0J family partition protein n=1 Tax=Streptomyces sp. NPDC026673 TaxID=3155724 RepID=UPI0033CA813D